MTDAELWKRLKEFRIGTPGDAWSFEKRIAHENLWTHDYARRVWVEYCRFLYLCRVCSHTCTPSVDVDQVWHLHLCYTRSYWEDLCPQVLGKPLHHGPTRGGSAEDRRFESLYAQTLASYAREFGFRPPEDIWPCARVRFGPASQRQWVNLSESLLIRKRDFKALLIAIGLLMVIAVWL